MTAQSYKIWSQRIKASKNMTNNKNYDDFFEFERHFFTKFHYSLRER